jgi:hypothetical protein
MGHSSPLVVLTSAGPIVRRTWKGPSNLSKSMTITFEHNSVTDIMFVDLCPVENGDNVEVIDVGKDLDFPGQIQARVNREKEIFYGITIQNFSGLKRALQWRYRMLRGSGITFSAALFAGEFDFIFSSVHISIGHTLIL